MRVTCLNTWPGTSLFKTHKNISSAGKVLGVELVSMNQCPQPDLPNGKIKDWDLRPYILDILPPELGGNVDVTNSKALVTVFCPWLHTGVYS